MSAICYSLSPQTASEYERIERRLSSPHRRRCIDGTVTGCGNCVGYCKYSEHPGFLTQSHRKEHDCIGKGCHYYVAKTKRERELPKVDRSKDILQTAINCTAFMEGMRILSARKKEDGSWVLRYVTLSSEYAIPPLEREISHRCGETVSLKILACDFAEAAKLIFES